MKAKIIILSLAIILSGCAIKSTVVTGSDGNQEYAINCNAGIGWCHKKAAKTCPNGYEVIEHSKKSSTRVAHYGEYPIAVNIESVTINCK